MPPRFERPSRGSQASVRSTMSRRSADRPSAACDRQQRLPRLGLPLGFERAPRAQRRRQPCRDLRIALLDRQHRLGEEVVAGAVGAVEAGLVGAGEAADQRAHPVGIGRSRRRDAPVSALTASSGCGARRRRLDRGTTCPSPADRCGSALSKRGERRAGLRRAGMAMREHGEGGRPVGHVGGGLRNARAASAAPPGSIAR